MIDYAVLNAGILKYPNVRPISSTDISFVEGP